MNRRRRCRYKFIGRDGNTLIWQTVDRLPGDSRVEEIRVSAAYFWASLEERARMVAPR